MTEKEPEYNDAFLLSIARRATQCLDPDDSPNDEGIIFTALGESVFTNWLGWNCKDKLDEDDYWDGIDTPERGSTREIAGVCYRGLLPGSATGS